MIAGESVAGIVAWLMDLERVRLMEMEKPTDVTLMARWGPSNQYC